METANTPDPGHADVVHMNKLLQEARACLVASKDAAMKAAAYAYMVWIASNKGHGVKWFEHDLQKRNTAITKHNDTIKGEYDRTAKLASGKLPDTDPLMETGGSAKKQAEREEEKERLLALNKHSKTEKANRLLVPIDARDGASQFTIIVKYAFEFDKPENSDQVSRYASALDWIHKRFADVEPLDVDEVVEVIKAAGGFENIVAEQRLVKSGDSKTDATKREMMRDQLVTDVCAALKKAPAKASVNIEARNSHDGMVLLLARKNGGSVEVLDEADLGEPDIKRAIHLYSPRVNLPYNPGSEFVSRVMRLGYLVQEGKPTDKTRFGLKSGEVIKTQRMVLLLPDEEHRPSIMMSAREADAAVIVQATPKGETELPDLCAVNEVLSLDSKARNRLEKMLKDFANRRYLDLKPDHDPMTKKNKEAKSPFAWQVENTLLTLKGLDGKEDSFFWHSLAGSIKPLEVELFRPQFKVTVTPQGIQHLFSTSLTAWAASVSGKKSSDLPRLVFEQDRITLRMKGAADQTIDSVGVVSEAVELVFRPRDLFNLFQALCEDQHGDEYTFEGDDGGLLKISWEDSLAYYSVYQPLATTDGRLQSRRLAPMRQRVAMAAE